MDINYFKQKPKTSNITKLTTERTILFTLLPTRLSDWSAKKMTEFNFADGALLLRYNIADECSSSLRYIYISFLRFHHSHSNSVTLYCSLLRNVTARCLLSILFHSLTRSCVRYNDTWQYKSRHVPQHSIIAFIQIDCAGCCVAYIWIYNICTSIQEK